MGGISWHSHHICHLSWLRASNFNPCVSHVFYVPIAEWDLWCTIKHMVIIWRRAFCNLVCIGHSSLGNVTLVKGFATTILHLLCITELPAHQTVALLNLARGDVPKLTERLLGPFWCGSKLCLQLWLLWETPAPRFWTLDQMTWAFG